MYDVVVTEEFASWFEALEDGEAESVAALLGVVAELGPGLGIERARRALLWYDGAPAWSAELEQRWRQAVESLEAFEAWRREAQRCLGSRAFSRLLSALPAGDAAAVLQSVEQLRQRLRTARWALGGLARASAYGREAFGAELKALFDGVMARVGLDARAMQASVGGLREVTLAELTPPARVIYGLDISARRVVVLVADRLDRLYYGDSVRLAEARFHEYRVGREGTRPLSVERGA